MKVIILFLFFGLIFPGKVMAQKKEFNVYLGNGYYADTKSTSGDLKEGTYRFGEVRFLPFRSKRTRFGVFANGMQSSYEFSGYTGDKYAFAFGPSLSHERRILIWRTYSWLNTGAEISKDEGGQGNYRQSLENKSWYASGGISMADTGMFNKEHPVLHQHKIMFTYTQPWESRMEEVIGSSRREVGKLNSSYFLSYQANITSLKSWGLRFDPFLRLGTGQEGYSDPPQFFQAGVGFEILRIYNQPLLAFSFQKKFKEGNRKMNIYGIDLNVTEVIRYFDSRAREKKYRQQREQQQQGVPDDNKIIEIVSK